MGNETKWADVAHYYAKSDHEVYLSWINDDGTQCEMTRKAQFEDFKPYYIERFNLKPILNHLRDMTEAQVLECIKCGWPVVAGKPIKEFACIPDHSEFGSAFTYKIVFDGSPHYMAGTMSFRSLDSNQFVWLISRGFDVFGLIESGQAIRKEAGNG